MLRHIRYLPRKVHHHLLPTEANNWQAILLKNTSLVVYLFFLASLVFVFNLIAVVKPGILGLVSNIQKDDIIQLTNQKRAESGLPPLSENSLLSQAAVAKANNMFTENYWAHVAPSGKTPWDFIRAVGYNYIAAGENLARDFDQSVSVVNAWLASPSHRENLLNPNYSEIGVGVVNGVLDGRQTTLVVQMFGTPARAVTAARTESAANQPSITPSPTVTPAVTVAPTPTVTPTPTSSEIQAREVEVVSNQPQAQVAAFNQRSPLINSYQIIRSVSLALLVMLLVLLTLDFVVVRKRHIARLTSQTVVHLGLLLVLLAAIWYTNSGLIL